MCFGIAAWLEQKKTTALENENGRLVKQSKHTTEYVLCLTFF
jgi:hypothetical protein